MHFGLLQISRYISLKFYERYLLITELSTCYKKLRVTISLQSKKNGTFRCHEKFNNKAYRE